MSTRTQPLVTASQLCVVLRSARKARKLTQAELAERLGLSQRRVSELEREPGTLSVHQLLAMFAQLGLQLSMQARDMGSSITPPSIGDW